MSAPAKKDGGIVSLSEVLSFDDLVHFYHTRAFARPLPACVFRDPDTWPPIAEALMTRQQWLDGFVPMWGPRALVHLRIDPILGTQRGWFVVTWHYGPLQGAGSIVGGDDESKTAALTKPGSDVDVKSVKAKILVYRRFIHQTLQLCPSQIYTHGACLGSNCLLSHWQPEHKEAGAKQWLGPLRLSSALDSVRLQPHSLMLYSPVDHVLLVGEPSMYELYRPRPLRSYRAWSTVDPDPVIHTACEVDEQMKRHFMWQNEVARQDHGQWWLPGFTVERITKKELRKRQREQQDRMNFYVHHIVPVQRPSGPSAQESTQLSGPLTAWTSAPEQPLQPPIPGFVALVKALAPELVTSSNTTKIPLFSESVVGAFCV